MKFLKTQIESFLNKNNIVNYELIEDKKHGYIINVNGNVNLRGKSLTKLKYKFGHVSGMFDISYNKLTSTDNFPDFAEYIEASNNNLSINIRSFIPKFSKYGIHLGSNFFLGELQFITDLVELETQIFLGAIAK